VVREFSQVSSNWRSAENRTALSQSPQKFPAIWDIDTRARWCGTFAKVGALRGFVSTDGTPRGSVDS